MSAKTPKHKGGAAGGFGDAMGKLRLNDDSGLAMADYDSVDNIGGRQVKFDVNRAYDDSNSNASN